MSGFDLRAASEEDVGTCGDLFLASANDLHRRYGMEEVDPADMAWLLDAIRHLIQTDPQGSVLAIEGEEPIGFATAYRRERYWFLSFLFVSPRAQGRGVGRTLLESVLPPDDDAHERALVVESVQPVSTGLYTSHGITPRTMRFRLAGLPDAARLPALPAEVEVTPLTTADLPALDGFDRRHLGYARSVEHAWWLSLRMSGWGYRQEGELVGYGYMDDEDDPGPVLGRDEATASAIVADLLRRAADPSAVSVPVYGSAGGLLTMLVRAGCRIAPTPFLFLYCSNRAALPPTYVAFAPYLP